MSATIPKSFTSAGPSAPRALRQPAAEHSRSSIISQGNTCSNSRAGAISQRGVYLITNSLKRGREETGLSDLMAEIAASYVGDYGALGLASVAGPSWY